MKVRVYFCKEPEIEIIIKSNKIGKQALDTIYDLVWECELKNILNVGRVWLKFKEEQGSQAIIKTVTFRIRRSKLLRATSRHHKENTCMFIWHYRVVLE